MKLLTLLLMTFAISVSIFAHSPRIKWHRPHYRLYVDSASYTITDKHRIVAHMNWGENPVMDSLILNDNQ